MLIDAGTLKADIEHEWCSKCKTAVWAKDCDTCIVNSIIGKIAQASALDSIAVGELIKLRDALYKADAITMAGLFQLNLLISERYEM